ncbi:MAG: MFS transporter [Candidatus Babeliaceae bacterium]|jgi:MFS family permease
MKTWIKKVFGFGLASFLSDFSHEMTISLIPILVTQFVGPVQAPFFLGIISSISDAFASFLRLVSGFLSDRLSRKKPLIMLGYGMSALFSTLVGFTHSIGGVLFYRMLSFTGSGLREPPRDALIAATIEPPYYGRAFGLKSAMDTLGSLIGPLVTFACVGILSMHWIFVLSCIPGMLAVAAIFFFTQDLRIHAKNTRISVASLWHDVRLLPRSFTLFLLILFIFDVGSFNKLLLLSRVQEIIVLEKMSIAQGLVLLYALFNSARAGSEFFIGLLSDYIHRVVLLALCGCGLLAVVAFLLLSSHGSLVYCAGIFALAGISAAAMTTLKKACAADMLPAHIRGLGYGVLQAAEGFAMLISSALIGFLWTHYSPTLGFSYVIVMSLTAMLLLLGLRRFL